MRSHRPNYLFTWKDFLLSRYWSHKQGIDPGSLNMEVRYGRGRKESKRKFGSGGRWASGRGHWGGQGKRVEEADTRGEARGWGDPQSEGEGAGGDAGGYYSIRTERWYCDWIRRYIRFHGMGLREGLNPRKGSNYSMGLTHETSAPDSLPSLEPCTGALPGPHPQSICDPSDRERPLLRNRAAIASPP